MQTLTALVFDDFETLDLFGPIELFGSLPNEFHIQFASMKGGIIHNHHGVALQTVAVAKLAQQTNILLVVGGKGTRPLINDSKFLGGVLKSMLAIEVNKKSMLSSLFL
ncbi:type 1 glutamine amidotransferase family protein [Psychrobacter faecalis]|uniref:hypothetical protein n=1 Tax=Psychrobacter faecalis TaxID=180588 RepID=UPI001866696D|nr:hypothetical protein [Psychrobacter faecalis]